jgi:hypothetical protein
MLQRCGCSITWRPAKFTPKLVEALLAVFLVLTHLVVSLTNCLHASARVVYQSCPTQRPLPYSQPAARFCLHVIVCYTIVSFRMILSVYGRKVVTCYVR